MPAISANADKFLLNTDYPVDKVVYMTSGSVTADNSGKENLINHGLPFRPLVLYTWSTTPDFTVSRTSGSIAYAGGSDDYVLSAYTPNNSQIAVVGYEASGSRTLYYRIYCLAPPDTDGVVPFTSNVPTYPFLFNTDNNYMKLFMEGIVAAPSSGNTISVTHGLGYRPRVLVWAANSVNEGIVGGFAAATPNFGTNDSIQITDTDLSFYTSSLGTFNQKYTYKIYADT